MEPFRPIRLATLHLAQHRSHVRGIVIDSRIGWTGGFGIDDKWLGDGRSHGSWRETYVRFEGPAVRQLQAAFVAAWAEATDVMFTGRATLDVQSDAATAAGLLSTAPTLGSTAAERFVALSIAAARKTLYITNSHFAPDRNFVELLGAAARRGVDVRILRAGPRTDVHIVRLAGRAWYETLLGSGVRVYEWQPTALHAKTFVVDGEWLTVGSMNFDNRSMALNDEATLMVPRSDAGQPDEPGLSRRPEPRARGHPRGIPGALMASTNRGAGRPMADAAALMAGLSEATFALNGRQWQDVPQVHAGPAAATTEG